MGDDPVEHSSTGTKSLKHTKNTRLLGRSRGKSGRLIRGNGGWGEEVAKTAEVEHRPLEENTAKNFEEEEKEDLRMLDDGSFFDLEYGAVRAAHGIPAWDTTRVRYERSTSLMKSRMGFWLSDKGECLCSFERAWRQERKLKS
jgi:hypothetical protein